MTEPTGFLTPASSLASDLSLLAYIFLIVPSMLVGFVFARRKMFVPYHKLTMTTITLVNWVIIALLMAVSYSRDVAPYLASDLGHPTLLLPTIHLVTGAVAQILGSYLVFRMWFEKVLPQWMMVKKIKIYMRFTLAMWLITAALGITIYAAWYVRPNLATSDFPPAVTPEISATDELDPLATDEPVATEDMAAATDEVIEPVLTDEPIATEDAAVSAAVDAAATDEVIEPVLTDEPVATEDVAAAAATDEIIEPVLTDEPIMTEEALPAATDTPMIEPVVTEELATVTLTEEAPTEAPTQLSTATPTPCPTVEVERIAPAETPEITVGDLAATPERPAPITLGDLATTPEVVTTPEIVATEDRSPTLTPTVDPCATVTYVPRQTPTRSMPITPVETPEVVSTPEINPAATPEVSGDDDNDNRGMGMGMGN